MTITEFWATLRKIRKWNEMKIKHLITKKGIQVLPSKTEDHRIITKVLDEAKYQYSVFKLPEEKTLKVAL